MTRVLVVSDNRQLAMELGCVLLSLGYGVALARHDGGLAGALDDEPDLLVLACEDLGELQERTRELRGAQRQRHIPVLAAFSSEEAIRELAGPPFFDDFVVLPVSPDELGTRLLALETHAMKAEGSYSVLGLRLDDSGHVVTVDGQPVRLTRKEYSLLKQLLAQKGRVLGRQELLDEVWSGAESSSTRTVDVHIRRLRAKLGPVYGPLIRTVRHEGYVLENADQASPQTSSRSPGKRTPRS